MTTSRVATKLAYGVPFQFLSGLDVDLNTRMVYFTDAISVEGKRIQKYWIKGPNDKTTTLIDFSSLGPPAKIKRTKAGDFWVVFNNCTVPTAVLIDSVGNVLNKLNLLD
ncbi:unnamed protein product [Prunus brigantina]